MNLLGQIKSIGSRAISKTGVLIQNMILIIAVTSKGKEEIEHNLLKISIPQSMETSSFKYRTNQFPGEMKLWWTRGNCKKVGDNPGNGIHGIM